MASMNLIHNMKLNIMMKGMVNYMPIDNLYTDNIETVYNKVDSKVGNLESKVNELQITSELHNTCFSLVGTRLDSVDKSVFSLQKLCIGLIFGNILTFVMTIILLVLYVNLKMNGGA